MQASSILLLMYHQLYNLKRATYHELSNSINMTYYIILHWTQQHCDSCLSIHMLLIIVCFSFLFVWGSLSSNLVTTLFRASSASDSLTKCWIFSCHILSLTPFNISIYAKLVIILLDETTILRSSMERMLFKHILACHI